MDQYAYLQNILEFIDRHITEEISVGQLARLAGFSSPLHPASSGEALCGSAYFHAYNPRPRMPADHENL